MGYRAAFEPDFIGQPEEGIVFMRPWTEGDDRIAIDADLAKQPSEPVADLISR